jgi:hypothetical protein
MEYEATVDAIFGQRRMLAIYTYTLSKCDALQIIDVISNHAFALVKRAGKMGGYSPRGFCYSEEPFKSSP